MILADTSVWIDHLRQADGRMRALLSEERVLGHPAVTAEVALGSLPNRSRVLHALDRLPSAPVATMRELRLLIEERALWSRGVGLTDLSLLAACLLMPGAALWTRDRRLDAVARELGVAAPMLDG